LTSEHVVRFQPIGRRIPVPAETSVFDAARDAGIELTSACGGGGRCGLCRVEVVSGDVSSADTAELAVLGPQAEEGIRLACRVEVRSDVAVRIPDTSLLSGPRLQVGGMTVPVELDPRVVGYQVAVSPPTLAHPEADLDRVLTAVSDRYGVRVMGARLPVVRSLSESLREHGWAVTAFVRGEELIGIAAPDTAPIGLAVDLGTTKIAAHLLDLATGEHLGAAGVANPQIAYGEDVISRLEHAVREPGGAEQLAAVASKAIDDLAGELIASAGRSRRHLADACIVGNTAMIHLLLGYPVHQLVKAPFVASSSQPIDVDAADIGLRGAPGATVHIPGSIGGFVGADHVAMILASGIDFSDRTVLGVDIGTNTEIVLKKRGVADLTATSCASGPAFEGAHITDGMRAAAGAIEQLQITDSGVEYATIDDAPPIGLCGSGIVDAVAELHRHGLVNPRGRFMKEHPLVSIGAAGPQLVLARAEATGSSRDVVITQHDVEEIQLAKGAIHAGVEILLEVAGTQPEEVDAVLIAGAFGSFLTVDSAIDIGLLPRLPRAGYRQVGNAAVVGAVRMLVSVAERRRAEAMLDDTSYEELTVQPNFGRRFARGMFFPELLQAKDMERTA